MEVINNCPQDEFDEELTIDFKKILFSLWSRRYLIVGVFVLVFALAVCSTFIMAKKYTVDADLYISKSNNSNLMEFNPYVLSDFDGKGLSIGGTNPLANDLEIMQSPLVIDKVIRENDIRFKKLYGFITTQKTGQYVTAENFVKNISFENKKGTNVITISYKSKNRELAYNIVTSVITNYIELQKEINSEKSKSDKKLIEQEYNRAKSALNKKISSVSGLPSNAVSGSGNLAAMSAFSTSAQKAMSTIQGQYVAGERSRLSVTEDAEKVAQLSSKLEWAKLVESVSDTSKVLVLKAPRQLQEWEQTSPKLFTNILFGVVFGVIFALIAVIVAEITDRKLDYSALSEKIIYNLEKDFTELKMILFANSGKRITLVVFEQIPSNILEKLKEFDNINMIEGDVSKHFANGVAAADDVIVFASIGKTDAKRYKQVKQMLGEMRKNILAEVLV